MKILIVALLLQSAAYAAGPRFESGPQQVSLIELYTSEGCSSCPPAEDWLSSLRESPGLWNRFVPVQFHVNYWDYLGWKDPLATRESTERQYAYAAAWGSRSVYTPCFVRDGAEWRPSQGFPTAATTEAGILTLALEENGSCLVSFRPPAGSPDRPYSAHVALLGAGLSQKVSAGENSGATLRHDFVVLALGGAPLAAQGPLRAARITLPSSSSPGARRMALAAWVTQDGAAKPIQATGGWLP